jgi:hypothetical protein
MPQGEDQGGSPEPNTFGDASREREHREWIEPGDPVDRRSLEQVVDNPDVLERQRVDLPAVGAEIHGVVVG